MKKIPSAIFSTLIIIFSLCHISFLYSQEIWSVKNNFFRKEDIRDFQIFDGVPYVATIKEMYTLDFDYDRWRSLFYLPNDSVRINCLCRISDFIFIGTTRGLFYSDDNGKSWRTIFRSVFPLKNQVLSINKFGRNGDRLIIGTSAGIFISEDYGRRWKDVSGVMKNRPVISILSGRDELFALSDNGIYRARAGQYSWQRIGRYSGTYKDITESEEIDQAIDEESRDDSKDVFNYKDIISIAVRDERLYAVSKSEIFYSEDKCPSWKTISLSGLRGDIRHFAVNRSDNRLFCATNRGVFSFSFERDAWIELPNFQNGNLDVNRIVICGEDVDVLWVLTDKGLYKYKIEGFVNSSYEIDVKDNVDKMNITFDDEPSLRQLQEAAIRYNDVSPEKIKKWQIESRLKALVPKISVGIDSNKSNTYEIYTSATKDYIVSGPDDINEGIDLSISWDLGNVIWSGDQSSIDVRSRLNTQLRTDILDALRRAYFERRRLQYELIATPPKDTQLKLEKELRIQEFTQVIDDLTGNYFSDHLRS